jgi:hypothetical protein
LYYLRLEGACKQHLLASGICSSLVLDKWKLGTVAVQVSELSSSLATCWILGASGPFFLHATSRSFALTYFVCKLQSLSTRPVLQKMWQQSMLFFVLWMAHTCKQGL